MNTATKIVALVYMGILSFVSCSGLQSPIGSMDQDVSVENNDAPGNASITITPGPIGSLSKSKTIILKGLYITISAQGEKTITDSFPLNASTLGAPVNKTYTNLSKDRQWTLTAVTRDLNGKTIHSGGTGFLVQSCKTTEVKLDLSSGFSGFNARIFPIQDSVTGCKIIVNKTVIAQQSFTAGSKIGDTIKLSYDYLIASISGVKQDVRFEVWGSMYGTQQVLYAADTTILVFSGENRSYSVNLKWVGPTTTPFGAAQMRVVLGAVGNVSMDAILPGSPSMFTTECVTTPLTTCNQTSGTSACAIILPSVCVCNCESKTQDSDFEHIIDLGKVFENKEFRFTIKPESSNSACISDGVLYCSVDGKNWVKIWYKNQMKAGSVNSEKVKITAKFRYLKATMKGCGAQLTDVEVQ